MPGQSDASKLKHFAAIRSIVKSRGKEAKNRYYQEKPFKVKDARALRILPEDKIIDLERLALVSVILATSFNLMMTCFIVKQLI